MRCCSARSKCFGSFPPVFFLCLFLFQEPVVGKNGKGASLVDDLSTSEESSIELILIEDDLHHHNESHDDSSAVSQLMERYDQDEDGFLSFEEYETFHNDVMAASQPEDDPHGHGHNIHLSEPFSRSSLGDSKSSLSVKRVSIRSLRQVDPDDEHDDEHHDEHDDEHDHDEHDDEHDHDEHDDEHDHDEHDDEHDHDDEHEHSENCMSADEMFTEYDFDHDSQISPGELTLLSPDLVLQVLDGCGDEHEESSCRETTNGEAWLYGMMSTLGISLLSAVGVVLIPIHNKTVKEYLINGLIAFAVGALAGDVLLHIIPHALGIHAHGEILDDVGGGRVYRELWLAFTICAGFVLFTCLDLVIRGIKAWWGVSEEDERRLAEISDEPEENQKKSFVRKMTGFDEQKIDYKEIKTIGYLNLVSDGLHNFIDGITIGLAWSDSIDLGLSTTIAIVAHEIPQELGDFGILIHSGFTKWQAILWNLASASFAMLGSVVGLAVGNNAQKAVPWLLALAAGNFLYISLVSMMPEALKGIRDVKSAFLCLFLLCLGFSILFVIAVFEETDC
eukprot:CAMPEP_0201482732 /NCGR_PEP_ID=MMETSP0151_2-20130828/6973_1 /ASSEMBLY_ACC=CAM_ASM_000257 /TAXON_ID=200890 /ORGANISM="Paramoeba atlantica, Strain 621/1 / CCAP 1560/9" /LENGTH=560 /DNA_ID=CAMNT_0047865561 /DNA_START=110 /DNA_END=1792 /DNA_ORIENTATION=+